MEPKKTMEWVNNCWWGWQNRTDLGICTHQCDGTQGNNSTQALLTKIVYFRCEKTDNKRRRKQRRGQTRSIVTFYISSFLSVLFFVSIFCLFFVFMHPKKTVFVESTCALLFPCISSHCHWWVHFPTSVPFCQPHQQLFTHPLGWVVLHTVSELYKE